MIRPDAVLLFLTTIVVISEQKPPFPIFRIGESELLEEIRPIRSITEEDTITPIENDSTTINVEVTDTTESEESTTILPKPEFDAFGFFLKIVTRRVEDNIEKRSVDKVADEDDIEDLDTAANTVFRPLFAYRLQNSQRRRLRRF